MTARERPIMFSAPMVCALLEGRKTQTRRIAKPRRNPSLLDGSWSDDYVLDPGNREWLMRECPYGQPGDRLWVRETWGLHQQQFDHESHDVIYRADVDRPAPDRWRSPIHMPRWASRSTLDVSDVRVQRLQDISEEDAIAEGLLWRHVTEGWTAVDADSWPSFADPRRSYAGLWNSINGAGSWDANPWVWVVSFRRLPQ